MAFSSMRPWLAGAAISISLASAAYAQDAKAVFEARYADLSAAMQAKDTAAVAKLMTPDFVMTDIQGNEHNASEMNGGFGRRGGGAGGPGNGAPAASPAAPAAAPAAPEAPRPAPKITVLSAQIDGNTAKVEQQLEIHANRPDPDGTPRKLDITVLTDDVWVQSGGAWLLQSSDQKDVSVSKDGDVVFHQAK